MYISGLSSGKPAEPLYVRHISRDGRGQQYAQTPDDAECVQCNASRKLTIGLPCGTD